MKLTRYLLLVCLLCPVFAYAQRPILISGGTVTANVTDYNDFVVTLTGNVTGVTLSKTVTPATGYQVTMRFVQDATGSRTVAFGGNITSSCSINSTANSVTICRWQYTASGDTWADAGGSSSSASSTGPVINVTNPIYAGGASSSNADNSAQFTAAVAAYNTSTNASQSGSPSVGAPTTATQLFSSATTGAVTVTLAANATTLVWVMDQVAGQAFTVVDSGGSVYTQMDLQYSDANTGTVKLFATQAGKTKASVSVTATTSGGAETFWVVIASYPNVTLIQNPLNTQGGAGTSLSVTQTTLRGSSTVAMGCQFFNSNVSSFSATTGTLRNTSASAVGTTGSVLMDNATVAVGSVPLAGTFSASTFTNCTSMELQSNGVGIQKPTLYVPAGYYTYSGGLVLTSPGVLKCEPGAVLNYAGTGHAVGLGPASGLTAATAIYGPLGTEGCEFTGGANYTQGVTCEPFVISCFVRASFFHNFGPVSTGPTSPFMIAGMNDNFDFEVGPQNRIITDDLIPRNVLRMNINATNEYSFLRFHDNQVYCLNGPSDAGTGSPGGGCPAASAGIGVWTDSHQNIVVMNSMAFFKPDLIIGCSAAGGASVCSESVVDGNILNPELYNSATLGQAALQFDGAHQGLIVHNNRFSIINNTQSPIGPRSGSATIQSSRFNFNIADNLSAATPFVGMNNLAGQSNNQSSNNMCKSGGIGLSSYSPCPIPHTTGSNIPAFTFNNDDGHQASGYFVVGTKFTTNNGCTDSATAGGATGGTFTVGSTSCTEVITMGDKLTAPNGWSCTVIDITTLADVTNPHQTTSTTTTATIVTGTVVSGDKIQFSCIGY